MSETLTELTEPLIDEENPQTESSDDDKSKAKAISWKSIPKTLAATNLTISLCFISIIFTSSGLVYFAMGLGIILSGVAILQRVELEKIGSLREAVQLLKEKANELKESIEQLESTSTELEGEAEKVHKLNEDLKSIVEEQGESVEGFINLVKEQKELVEQGRTMAKQSTLTQIFSFIVRTDVNKNFRIDEDELPFLVMNLRNCEGLHNMNEEKFHSVCHEKGYKISTIVEVCYNVLEKWELEEEKKEQVG